MTTFLLPQIMFFIRTLFIITNHPLTLRFLLILTRVFYSLIIYFFSLTSWIPYILVIVFLSGIIIIIIYITSLSSNEPISFSKESIIFAVIINTFIFFLNFFSLNFNFSNLKFLNNLNNFNNLHSSELIYKTYNTLNWEITSLLIIYLFIVLIAAVKITSLNSGPLRTKK